MKIFTKEEQVFNLNMKNRISDLISYVELLPPSEEKDTVIRYIKTAELWCGNAIELHGVTK